MDKIPKVLFLSRGSASRGQMAEGFLRLLGGDRFIVFSAGSDGADVSPLAVEVMLEVGIDITTQQPSKVATIFREAFHCVVALCDASRERYPVYPFTGKILRWPVPDPEVATGEPEERKEVFRKVRDQLRNRVEEFIEALEPKKRAKATAQAAAA